MADRLTARLRLTPVSPANAHDLWLVQDDEDVWPWYGDAKPGRAPAERSARSMAESWRRHGVHKWIAYDRVTGEVIGRAGLAFAFEVLHAQAVVSCTVRHNVRSRAVMERIGMRYAGEIRSRGPVETAGGEHPDAPFAVGILLARDWRRS